MKKLYEDRKEKEPLTDVDVVHAKILYLFEKVHWVMVDSSGDEFVAEESYLEDTEHHGRKYLEI